MLCINKSQKTPLACPLLFPFIILVGIKVKCINIFKIMKKIKIYSNHIFKSEIVNLHQDLLHVQACCANRHSTQSSFENSFNNKEQNPLERKVSMDKEITELKHLICGRDTLELQQLKPVRTWCIRKKILNNLQKPFYFLTCFATHQVLYTSVSQWISFFTIWFFTMWISISQIRNNLESTSQFIVQKFLVCFLLRQTSDHLERSIF